MSRNNVRGPASALTEFLKASGITPATIARRATSRRQTQAQAENEDQPTAGPSTAVGTSEASPSTPQTQNSASGSRAGSSRPRRSAAAAAARSGYASDNLDGDEGGDDDSMQVDETPAEAKVEAETEPVQIGTKRKRLTKAQEAKLKAQEKKKMQQKKRNGKKGEDDDYESDDDDDDDDAYTAPSRSKWTNATKPPIGNFEDCASCGKQFTVTKYTVAKNGGGGWLCYQCTKSNGQDPFKKQAAPRKRKAPTEKRNVTNFEEKRFPSLVSLCVQLIAKYIDDVEAFGDIGSLNLEAIAKALSKSRNLNPANAQLFYSSTNTTLTFYDATNLDPPAFETLAYQNANLVSLRLDFCGRMDDAAMKVLSTSLPHLERVELLGPFLVRPPAWVSFFQHHGPKLTSFLITQSPRFDNECVRALTKSCPNLVELRLSEIGHMDDGFLKQIQTLKSGVTLLDISHPGSEGCTDTAVIGVLKAFGKTLRVLNLANHIALTDNVLTKGIVSHLRVLDSLTLSHLPEITSSGLASVFLPDTKWKNPPLRSIDLSRNDQMGSDALEAIVEHSGSELRTLSINGWKDVSREALVCAGVKAVELRRADVSWCREFDDYVLGVWLEGAAEGQGLKTGGCLRLEEIKVWGCNRVSGNCPKKKGVIIRGVESHQVR